MRSRASAVPHRGFTLIELMITVAIVAILATIAYPSYASYLRKGRRATAQAALMDLAAKQQSYLLDRRLYTNSLSGVGFSAPAEIANDYTFTITCTPADCSAPTSFLATATPSSTRQSAGGELALSIDNTGAKLPVQTGYWK